MSFSLSILISLFYSMKGVFLFVGMIFLLKDKYFLHNVINIIFKLFEKCDDT